MLSIEPEYFKRSVSGDPSSLCVNTFFEVINAQKSIVKMTPKPVAPKPLGLEAKNETTTAESSDPRRMMQMQVDSEPENAVKAQAIKLLNDWHSRQMKGLALRLPMADRSGEYLLNYSVQWTEWDVSRYIKDGTLPRSLVQIQPRDEIRSVWVIDANDKNSFPVIDRHLLRNFDANPAIFIFWGGAALGAQVVLTEHLELEPVEGNKVKFVVKQSYYDSVGPEGWWLTDMNSEGAWWMR